MKIYLKLPDGGEFRYESTPMSESRFGVACFMVAGAAILLFFFGIIFILR